MKTNVMAALFLSAMSVSAGQEGDNRPQTPARDLGDLTIEELMQESIVLTKFDVNSASDNGYIARNAVSATRAATAINDLPFSVSVFTPQFIEDTGSQTLMDIVSQSAGVKSGVSGTEQGNGVFSIRGFVQSAQRNGFSSNQLVSNYVDASVIERVEIVKGPASLLYGAIAPGGTVNYITKSAELKPFSDVQLFVGSYDASGVTLDVNQPLIANQVLFRLVATYKNGEEYYRKEKSRTIVLYPTLKWVITPKLALTVDYQGYQGRQNPPAVYQPNSVVATPDSIVQALYAPGHPSASSALSNATGVAAEEGISVGSDPGYMGPFPGLPKNFNYADIHDVKFDDLKTFDAQLDSKLGEHWSGRIHFEEDIAHSTYGQTGHASAYIAPPDSMVYANNVWTVAPSWAALSPDQQVARSLAYAEQAVNNLSLLQSTQNGTPSPVIMDRAPRVLTQSVQASTLQAEEVGIYDLAGIRFQVLGGVFYDHVRYSTLSAQNLDTASSPFFRAWDVNPSSPTYHVDFREGNFTGNSLSSVDTNSTAINSDQAAYALLSASFFGSRLQFMGGARYNVSSNQVYDHISNSPSPGLRDKHLTPQVGLGFKLTPNMMVYASYSESYTLPTQPYLTMEGTVNGAAAAIPTGPTSPTIGKGYEAGLKADLLNHTLNLGLSAYQIEEENVLQNFTQTINGHDIDIWNQGAEQRGRGLEASLGWIPQPNWQIMASVAEEDIRNIAEPDDLDYYLWANVGYAAKPSAHLWTRYDLPGAWRGWWVGGGCDYSGRSAGDPRNASFYLPSYTLVNSAVGYDWSVNKLRMSAVLHFKNMGDTFYKDTPQSIGEPRRLLFSLTLHF